ncbi:hypothetical protein CerSpe_089080 [Prunus speciosa]
MQAFTLRSYPCKLSLAALTCFWGLVEGAILALSVERRNSNADWSIHLDIRLLAAFYGGILSGVAYYIMGMMSTCTLGVLLEPLSSLLAYIWFCGARPKTSLHLNLSITQSQPNDEPITTSQQQMMPEGGLDIEPGGEPKTNIIDS